MGFTNLISRSSPEKALSTSDYDKEFVVATIKKIYKTLNPLDNGKSICNAIGSNLENSIYAKIRNYMFISVLKSVNSTVSISNLKNNRTEFCNSICIPSDFSNIYSTKISYQFLLFFNFQFLIVAL